LTDTIDSWLIFPFHPGWAFLSGVRAEIEHLEELQTNEQPVWITGHSLGGALAALTYATLRLQEPRYEIEDHSMDDYKNLCMSLL
jgi:acetyl esterase/lipase